MVACGVSTKGYNPAAGDRNRFRRFDLRLPDQVQNKDIFCQNLPWASSLSISLSAGKPCPMGGMARRHRTLEIVEGLSKDFQLLGINPACTQ